MQKYQTDAALSEDFSWCTIYKGSKWMHSFQETCSTLRKLVQCCWEEGGGGDWAFFNPFSASDCIFSPT